MTLTIRRIAATITLLAGASVASGQWEILEPPTRPEARSGASLTAVDGVPYLFGGFTDDGRSLDDLWRWDDGSEDWIAVNAANPPSPRWGHQTVAADGRLYLIFGQDGTPDGSIWVYDPSSNDWTDLTPPAVELVSRHLFGAVIVTDGAGDDWIVVAGGQSFFFQTLSETWALRIRDHRFQRLADLPGGRWNHLMATVRIPSSARSDYVHEPIVLEGLDEAGEPGDTLRLTGDSGDLQDYEWAAVTGISIEASFGVDTDGEALRVTGSFNEDGSTSVCGGSTGFENLGLAGRFRFALDGNGDLVPVVEELPLPPRLYRDMGCTDRGLGEEREMLTFGGQGANGLRSDTTQRLRYHPSSLFGVDLGYQPVINLRGEADWQTSVAFVNEGEEPCEVLLALFIGIGGDLEIVEDTVTVPAWGQAFFPDVLQDLLALEALGYLHYQSQEECAEELRLYSRIFSKLGILREVKTYGQGFPPQPASSAATSLRPATLLQLRGGDDFRTNLGFIPVSGTATVRVTMYDSSTGAALGSTETALTENQLGQINRVFSTVAPSFAGQAWALVEILDAGAQVLVYGSVIDERTDDATTIFPADALDLVGSDGMLIPAAIRADGLGTPPVTWQTTLTLRNAGATAGEVSLRLLPSGGGVGATVTRTLAAGESWNPTAEELALDAFGSGAVLVTGDATVQAMSRTFSTPATEPNGPTSGQGIPGVALSELLGSGSDTRVVGGLLRSADPASGFRSNLGLVNPDDVPVEVEALFVDGSQDLGTVTFSLPPGSFQIVSDAFARVTGGDVHNGWIQLKVITPKGRAFVFGSLIDNLSGDASFVAGQ